MLPNGLPISRIGFSVSKRVGGAVVRNRVRRRLREIVRAAPLKPGRDIVFIARPASATADYATLDQTARALLAREGLLQAAGLDGVSTPRHAGAAERLP
jgi:ribonuclease P protein component